jgi:hypothetical protein
MDKIFPESNLTRFIISGSVRQKSLNSKVAECDNTSCTTDSKNVSTQPSKMDKEISINDDIGTSLCSKTLSENSELDKRNVHASDCPVNIDSAASPKTGNCAPVSIQGTPDGPLINSETGISLVSHDYNFSCSDESSS